MVPYYAGQADAISNEIARYREASPTAAWPPLAAKPPEYFRKFYNDAMVNGLAAAMRCGLEFFGTGQIMYGTDFPTGSNDGVPARTRANGQARVTQTPPSQRVMIHADLGHRRARSVGQAISLLAVDEDASLLAGGHPLIQLRFRCPPLLDLAQAAQAGPTV